MYILHTHGSRGIGSISLGEYVTLVDKAKNGEQLGTFEKLWDAIKDFIQGTHVGQAKSLLLSILSDETPDWVRLAKFRVLQSITRNALHPVLEEVACNGGVTICIMSSMSRDARTPKTICLFEKLIPDDQVDIADGTRRQSGTDLTVSYAEIDGHNYADFSRRSSFTSYHSCSGDYDADNETDYETDWGARRPFITYV